MHKKKFIVINKKYYSETVTNCHSASQFSLETESKLDIETRIILNHYNNLSNYYIKRILNVYHITEILNVFIFVYYIFYRKNKFNFVSACDTIIQ